MSWRIVEETLADEMAQHDGCAVVVTPKTTEHEIVEQIMAAGNRRVERWRPRFHPQSDGKQITCAVSGAILAVKEVNS